MAIRMAGIDHSQANLDVRSVFSFTKKRMEQIYSDFMTISGIEGCVLISTCNRMEIWLSVSDESDIAPVSLLCGFVDVSTEEYGHYFTERRREQAVDHLFRLAAGLESQIVGEDQIITQVGEALAFARSCYATDQTLEVLFRLAVTAGKRIKTELSLTTADRSVIHTALRELADEGISVANMRCLVIGNGMMGRITAKTLLEQGADVTVTVRQYRSGVVDIPSGCKRINYDERLGFLPDCDMVVSATSSPNFTLRLQELAEIRRDRPIYMIDLAVPRDIDPAAGQLDWVTLYDIDSFRIDLQSENFRTQLAQANVILQEEEERFHAWYGGRDFVRQIRVIKDRAGEDVTARMTGCLRKMSMGEERKSRLCQEVEGAVSRMMNHLLFSLRDTVSDSTFRECLDAMVQIYNHQDNET